MNYVLCKLYILSLVAPVWFQLAPFCYTFAISHAEHLADPASTVETLPQDIPTSYPDPGISGKKPQNESVSEKCKISRVSWVFDILKYKVLIATKIHNSAAAAVKFEF